MTEKEFTHRIQNLVTEMEKLGVHEIILTQPFRTILFSTAMPELFIGGMPMTEEWMERANFVYKLLKNPHVVKEHTIYIDSYPHTPYNISDDFSPEKFDDIIML